MVIIIERSSCEASCKSPHFLIVFLNIFYKRVDDFSKFFGKIKNNLIYVKASH